MIRKKFILTVAIAIASLTFAASANAVTFDWDDLNSAASPGSALTPTGTSYIWHDDFVSANLASGAVNVLSANATPNGSLVYSLGGLTATATGTYTNGASTLGATVVHDHGNAGLGVYHTKNTSDDNVTGGSSTVFETLTLTFSQEVTITGLSFRGAGHGLYGAGSTDTYLFNGAEKTFGSSNSAAPTTGTVFTFAYGGSRANQFYLSTLTAVPTPDGGTTAVLLGLGLFGMAAVRRRMRG